MFIVITTILAADRFMWTTVYFECRHFESISVASKKFRVIFGLLLGTVSALVLLFSPSHSLSVLKHDLNKIMYRR